MSDLPSYDLEQQAARDRRQLHGSVVELRDVMRDTLDVQKNLREHLVLAMTATACLAFALGYAVTGMFTAH